MFITQNFKNKIYYSIVSDKEWTAIVQIRISLMRCILKIMLIINMMFFGLTALSSSIAQTASMDEVLSEDAVLTWILTPLLLKK